MVKDRSDTDPEVKRSVTRTLANFTLFLIFDVLLPPGIDRER